MPNKSSGWQMSTSLRLTLSFILVAFIGSLLLSLPILHQPSTDASYFDHLMTAISLVCVSGMAALPLAETYNIWGQIIALILIQVGGLGVITILNVGIYYLNRRLSLQDQYLLQQSLSRDTNKNLYRFFDINLSIYFSGRIGWSCLYYDRFYSAIWFKTRDF
ncbi:hypothetical protein ACF3NG_00535 [Aerococcaceae bacterium WGS1372]